MRDCEQTFSPAEGGAYADLLAMIAEAMSVIAKITCIKKDLERLEASIGQAIRSRLTPAVPIEKSIERDRLVCLVDGARVTVLSRYIQRYGLTPESYRAVFGLPADYPMVPPAYSEERAEIARKSKMWAEVDHSAPRKRRSTSPTLAVSQ